MNKPTLSIYGITEGSLQSQRTRRVLLRFLTIPCSLAVATGNYWLWIELHPIIGDWSLAGLFLTLFGLIPGVFSYTMLEVLLARCFYNGVARYEVACRLYEKWFSRTQTEFWDSLTGRQFEVEVAALLNRVGHSATVTPASGDKGVDVLLADGTIVQCKAHKAPVSPGVARELYGTLEHFGSPKAILVSKSGFTKGVYEFVQGKSIELWDTNTLISMQSAAQ